MGKQKPYQAAAGNGAVPGRGRADKTLRGKRGAPGSQPGFTLFELLIVILTVAVTGSMLLPALSRAGENNNMARCISNVSQVGRGFLMYAADWDGWLVPNYSGPVGNLFRANIVHWGHPPYNHGVLLARNYISDEKKLFCPDAKRLRYNPGDWPIQESGVSHIASSYVYYTGIRPGESELRNDEAYINRRVVDISSGKVFFADNVHSSGVAGDWDAYNNHGREFNTFAADGSVVTVALTRSQLFTPYAPAGGIAPFVNRFHYLDQNRGR